MILVIFPILSLWKNQVALDRLYYTQARIISDYFKTVKGVGEIDLEAMYNSYIAKWNADSYDEEQDEFKDSSALSLVVILDTLDALLDGAGIDEHSLLLSSSGEFWRVLAESKCWADVNDRS